MGHDGGMPLSAERNETITAIGAGVLAVEVDLIADDGESRTYVGIGGSLDSAVEDAIRQASGRLDPYNEARGWAMNDWRAA